jgi:hypothetical protein
MPATEQRDNGARWPRSHAVCESRFVAGHRLRSCTHGGQPQEFAQAGCGLGLWEKLAVDAAPLVHANRIPYSRSPTPCIASQNILRSGSLELRPQWARGGRMWKQADVKARALLPSICGSKCTLTHKQGRAARTYQTTRPLAPESPGPGRTTNSGRSAKSKASQQQQGSRFFTAPCRSEQTALTDFAPSSITQPHGQFTCANSHTRVVACLDRPVPGDAGKGTCPHPTSVWGASSLRQQNMVIRSGAARTPE